MRHVHVIITMYIRTTPNTIQSYHLLF